jgi:putative ABC transport system permease protein
MRNLIRDIAYSVRTSIKNPGFTLVVILTLALGMGPNTVIFTVLDGVLFNEGPYVNADQLVVLNATDEVSRSTRAVSFPDFEDWRKTNQSFERMAAYRNDSLNLRHEDSVERVTSQSVTLDFFPALGVTPLLGRMFVSSDFRESEETAVILSHVYWKRRFGGSPAILGTEVFVDGSPARVVGVMPRNFRSFFEGRGARMWVPLAGRPEQLDRTEAYVQVLARPKAGLPREQVEGEMKLISAQLASQYPGSNTGRGVRIRTIREIWMGTVGPGPRVLAFMVFCILLVACANVANVLLARGVLRKREIAMRRALGAGRFRIIRQLLTESVFLGLLGGVAGVLFAYGGLGLVNHYGGDLFLGLGIESFEMDSRTLQFAAVLGLVAGVIFGLVPAFRTSRVSLAGSLKEGGGVVSAGRGKSRIAGMLVVSELVIATLMLVAVSLHIRTYVHSTNLISDPGFRVAGVLTSEMAISERKFESSDERSAFYSEILRRISRLPGIESAGLVNSVAGVWSPPRAKLTVGIADTSVPVAELPGSWVDYRIVSADYFRTLDIPLIKGRFFSEFDNAKAPRVAIVSQRAATENWKESDPVGTTISINGVPHTVVGVVGNVTTALRSTDRESEEVCVSYLQECPPVMRAVILTNRPAESLVTEVRQQARAVGPDEALSELQTMTQYLDQAMWGSRFLVGLFVAFALLAVMISAAGVYGVMSHFVSQKVPEIGIRMALGAARKDVLRQIVRQGATLVAIGMGIGLVLSFGMVRVLPTVMFGLVAVSPVIYVGIVLALTGIALLACYLPARRAATVDPLTALRCE